jgi:hypothetical protein
VRSWWANDDETTALYAPKGIAIPIAPLQVTIQAHLHTVEGGPRAEFALNEI